MHSALSSIISKLPFSETFWKFSIVGGTGTLIDFGLLNLLVVVFSVNVYLAASIAFALACTNNFFLNKFWTFDQIDHHHSTNYQFAMFVAVSIGGLMINLSIMAVGIELFGLWYNWAKFLAIGVVVIWNYNINKRWTFTARKTVSENINQ